MTAPAPDVVRPNAGEFDPWPFLAAFAFEAILGAACTALSGHLIRSNRGRSHTWRLLGLIPMLLLSGSFGFGGRHRRTLLQQSFSKGEWLVGGLRCRRGASISVRPGLPPWRAIQCMNL